MLSLGDITRFLEKLYIIGRRDTKNEQFDLRE